jgi:hypothetical protein
VFELDQFYKYYGDYEEEENEIGESRDGHQ